MKAIQLSETHQPVQLIDAPIPSPGPDDVLIQLRAAALNHRDVFVQQGLYPGMKLPTILGSDGAGVITETGSAVDTLQIGQEVIINPALNWGDNPRFYGSDFRILGMPENGTFAEYLAIPARYVHAKPAHLRFEQAAAIPLVGLTAWRALMTRARLTQHQSTERVLITGIGGGAALSALQFAVAAGAEVWVTSGDDEKIQRAIELGAKGGVNYRQADWLKQLMTQTGGGRAGYFDVIIDSAGGPGFAKLTDAAASGGRIVFYGGTTGNITDLVPPKVFFKQLDIMGTTMGNEQEFADMLAFVSQHKIVPVVDSVMPLDETEQALRRMDEGKQFGKIVLSIAAN
ncbi:zinc-binding dehydrogenase [Spirosoma rhododendri]|uniref:Zinc-binding dehydrogenase n=1 Tax=Spirosoma rhododendri TaxID=2728024 RepID=A0A7L5DR80_9BACT|nr:zinc-binding dehydrogenase [Spirosoma rhododendri]QJD78487.1 zinc-binding dehydrogenase [Spirosoma rhododendri]